MRLITARSYVKLTSVPGEGGRGSVWEGCEEGKAPGGGVGGLTWRQRGLWRGKNRSLGECEQLNIVLSPAPAEATFKCASVQSSYVITHNKKK